ncbi:PMU1 [Candida jiufengensis]|uniref:PMU1 n=1 Tax=Candida jiufengensis TaxID=497108 RepID=UPI002225A191|nr:PMU1 [Candida jiufengensis]KAI5951057.1 PMU1 [Candida jiufengensis]
MSKSLLIPTENDYLDAHGDQTEQKEYNELWKNKLSKERNSQGELIFPWSFEVVQGFFKQSDESTDDRTFNYVNEHMGRLKSWEDITGELLKLNQQAPDNVEYKLLFLARHGQGYHNTIVEKYGLEQWEKKLHKLGDYEGVHYGPDPELTEIGQKQAKENHDLWEKEIKLGAPIPDKFYVSPLQRSCNTLKITWDGLKPDSKIPYVKEKLRETIGKNLCDKRSSKSIIKDRFGIYGFNTDGIIEEEDTFFTDIRETMVEQSIRINEFLQELFSSDCDSNGKVNKEKSIENIFISTHSHAGTIRAFLNVLFHRNFTISTGGMIPVVIKGTKRQ